MSSYLYIMTVIQAEADN